MTDGSQDAFFTSFWHRSVDKISSKKVKFMPNVTKPKTCKWTSSYLCSKFSSSGLPRIFFISFEIVAYLNITSRDGRSNCVILYTLFATLMRMAAKDEDGETKSAAAQKQHRRAQVRRAQIEHRQRKQNYVKHLEEDVIRLREMIAATENESSALMKENRMIKSTLSAAGVKNFSNVQSKNPKLPRNQPTIFLPPQEYDSFSSLTISESKQSKRPSITPIDYERENDRLSSYISDMLTQDSSPLTNYFPNGQDVPYKSSTSTGLHVNIQFNEFVNAPCLYLSESSNSCFRGSGAIDLSKPLPPLPDPAPPFDATGNPSGHELMASTYIFSHAPPEAFHDPTPESSWLSTSISLAQLYAMSQSLPTSDFEITPVQAWFMITEKYYNEIEKVIESRRMENLKRGLGNLSRCYQFGAVMDVESFWEVVDEIMAQDGT
ncbi:hypothetical protein NHQ30_000427 [Ciborinia camelliae]|nr:hypothetical protein NHQ30_000427 [Ciborinia camelliae]